MPNLYIPPNFLPAELHAQWCEHMARCSDSEAGRNATVGAIETWAKLAAEKTKADGICRPGAGYLSLAWAGALIAKYEGVALTPETVAYWTVGWHYAKPWLELERYEYCG